MEKSLSEQFVLDGAYRGFPSSASSLRASELASRNWAPADGEMNLPLLSVDVPTFDRNLDALMSICAELDTEIAPHIKTPMAPSIALRMTDRGAWGVSVADIRQATVMLSHGITRLILANETGGRAAARRLEALCSAHAEAELLLFVDSAEGILALDAAWSTSAARRPQLLLEVGMGRGGVDSNEAFDSLLAAAENSSFVVSGAAAYEGMAMRPHTDASAPFVAELLGRVTYAIDALRALRDPGDEIILTIGGSALFDYAMSGLAALRARDTALRIIMRSGAAVFGDHGLVAQRLGWIANRNLLGDRVSGFIRDNMRPSLRLWAEVLTKPSDTAAICGMGMRDVGDDQGLPVPLRVWRDGTPLVALDDRTFVAKLNDQHGFMTLAEDANIVVGDVIELGLRHPCTTIDKHGVIYGLGPSGHVVDAFKTYFG